MKARVLLLALCSSILALSAVGHAQTGCGTTTTPCLIRVSDLSTTRLIAEHDGLRASWWQTCRNTTCSTIPPVASTEQPVTPGNKVWEFPMPTGMTVGTVTVGVRACNDFGCSPRADLIFLVSDTAPNAPVSPLRFRIAVPPIARNFWDGDGVEKDLFGLQLRPDSPYNSVDPAVRIGPDVLELAKLTCGVRAGRPCDENGNLLTDEAMRARQ